MCVEFQACRVESSSVSKSSLPSKHLRRRSLGRPACNERKQKVRVHVCEVTFFAVNLELVASHFEVVVRRLDLRFVVGVCKTNLKSSESSLLFILRAAECLRCVKSATHR